MSVKWLTIANGLVFVCLNVCDAYLSIFAISRGAYELNPIVEWYMTGVATKSLVAIAIALILIKFRKVRILRVLNAVMVAIVIWNLVAVNFLV